ncbi:DNA repair protein Nse1 [Saccharata proteae CBS 121410]|uniref:Non-structural maintenance of chromosomes element 1 homolog n=1 Tax=Saccharata proteae CBS 121410 TaxID=1314787 RepID=A0A9P4LY10_9PEZI|nr:DNA repair protein Nse1 [Saccharata proteae CBS 121410]
MADEPIYNHSHRAFLQVFLARSVLTFEEAQPILAAIISAKDGEYSSRHILPADITPADLTTYISTLNTELSPLDLEIRSSTIQSAKPSEPSEKVYALVNTVSDDLTQLATTHSPDDIAFVKRLLDAMFETYNTRSAEVCAVREAQALNLAKVRRESGVGGVNGDGATQGGQGSSLTMVQAQEVLGRLVEEGWFEKSRGDYYSLSARALMELRGWLVDVYNEEGEDGEKRIKFCEACGDIVTVGQRCSDRDCICRLHNHCLQRFFRAHPDHKCPRCKTHWDGDRFVGEKAARAQPPRNSAASARPSAPTSRRTTTTTLVDDEVDEQDGEGQEEGEDEEE